VLCLYNFLFFRFDSSRKTTKIFYEKNLIFYRENDTIIKRIHRRMQVLMHVLTRVIIWFNFKKNDIFIAHYDRTQRYQKFFLSSL
jgi:hypothetical protein